MSASIELRGVEEIQRKLNALSGPEMKTAIRNTLNDTAFDARKALSDSIGSIFDRPTPLIVKSPYVNKATKDTLEASVQIGKDSMSMTELIAGKKLVDAGVFRRALEPHIPGFSSTRAEKGMEYHLRRLGMMRNDQYLMPSRTMKLDRYGNVPGSVASKMLADIGAYAGVAGFPGTTKERKAQYVWGTVKARKGGTVTGIWKVKGGARRMTDARWDLMMLVVDRAPHYRKVFDFNKIGLEAGRKVIVQHASKAVDFVLGRRRMAA